MSRIVTVALVILLLSSSAWAAKVDIPAPNVVNNEAFGTEVKVLPNGNFVVTDPYFDFGNQDIGAVYLYSRAGVLINTLIGSQANDRVGSGGITVLSNGNYVVASPEWNNGAQGDAGAVTWRSANGANPGGGNVAVSAANSLVGTQAGDYVGEGGVTALTNGNYVVNSPYWNPAVGGAGGVKADVAQKGLPPGWGAVTWGNGAGGTVGAVSALNSLVGSHDGDYVGGDGVTALSNGNYVVNSPDWDNPAGMGTSNVGAVTWGNGATGISGAVSVVNSLVGSTAYDSVGSEGVTVLSNGNYVVNSPEWNNPAGMGTSNVGAVTWGNGATGISGAVSVVNSLVGSTAYDSVGSEGVTVLSNGNYVVSSPSWSNAAANVGAVTWRPGSGNAAAIGGEVSAANSLVGSHDGDYVGGDGVTALTNGNYVVSSPRWDNSGGTADVGAVTWRPGAGATADGGDEVAEDNSLVGGSDDDRVGSGGVTALSNGHYVVSSPRWGGDVGAVTWRNGTMATWNPVTFGNSLYGNTSNDLVGSGGVVALSNGNYVVSSPSWDNGANTNAGAVTWRSGISSLGIQVSTGNSLYGNGADFNVGSGGVTALGNGHYVVASPLWGALLHRGAVTWGDGEAGITDSSPALSNSLSGSTAEDQVGIVTALPNNDYVVHAPRWDNGGANAGAMVWGSGSGGTEGAIDPDADNTVAGTTPNGGEDMVFAYAAGDGCDDWLAIGRPADNIVTLLGNPGCLFSDGFE